jgi:hypothetical protein
MKFKVLLTMGVDFSGVGSLEFRKSWFDLIIDE